jgi:hypothetical protein
MRSLQMLAGALMLLVLVFGTAAAQGVQLTVQSPQEGATVKGADVTVQFQTNGIQLVDTNVPISEAGKRPDANKPGQGHVHFMLDLQPLVVWTKGDPYTFSNLPPGQHQLMVEVVENDHSPLSPPVRKEVHFTTQLDLPQTGNGAEQSSMGGTLALLALGLVFAGGVLVRRNLRRRNTGL